jgi:hypothetical protein
MAMRGKLSLSTPLALLVTFGIAAQAPGVPLPSESLKVGTVMEMGKDLPARSSMYNPRSFGGKNYLVQINAPQRAVGCYVAGSTNYEALANIKDGAEVRMAGAFPAAGYVLLAGGADNDYFSRIDPNLNLNTRILAKTPAVMPNSFDWVDEDTIVHASYKSGLRTNLYLMDIKPDPFQVTANTSWNANGFVTTPATTRIRNVRVGDHYRGYAYYGDSGVKNAGFWALNLATGVSTPLGTLAVTGDGSWGLWTVKEVDGFLYVHTTHDGIYVFTMTDATTLGTLHTRYPKAQLDTLAKDANPNWGFDVVEDGVRMLLSAGLGRVIELIDSRIADAPNPPVGAADARQTAVLSWSPGAAAAAHDVYFGVDSNGVAQATPAVADLYRGRQALDQTTYDPGPLEWGKVYYWRIDEVNEANPGSPWKGRVWTFTTADFLVVDDMESYTDDEGRRIYETWIDGYPDRNGSTVGNLIAPFAEQTIVHGGRQALPMDYENAKPPFYSEAVRQFAEAQDWTVHGVSTLVLFVRGAATNIAAPLYIAVEDGAGKSAVATHPDATVVTKAVWTEWKVPLSSFSGVNPAKIKKLSIGVGNRTDPKASVFGRLYLDDIRVVKP